MNRNAAGFTLMELVVVMILIGVLGALTVGRFFDSRESEAAAYANRLRAQLRYGQKLAIAQQRPVYVQFAGTRAALCYDAGCAIPVPAPGGGNSSTAATSAACGSASWYCEASPSSVSVTYNAAKPAFWFDANGQPFDAADPMGATSSNYAAINVTVSAGSFSTPVQVEPATGYVY
jgi:MSHA pilin protein MshC